MTGRMYLGGRPAAVAGGLLLAAAGLAGAAGLAADASSGTGQVRDISVSLGYTCQPPSGQPRSGQPSSGGYRITVVIAAAFPAAATAGQPVRPGSVRLTIQLPRAALPASPRPGSAGSGTAQSGLARSASARSGSARSGTARSGSARSGTARSGTAGVTGAGTLAVAESAAGRTVTAQWPVRLPAPAPVPATGLVTLTADAAAAPVTPAGTGPVTFTAGRLALGLSFRTAGGLPASPATVRITCAPASGTSALLDSVLAGPGHATHGGAAGASPARRGKIPKGCGQIPVKGQGVATCGYLTGYQDAAKLGGAALLQPRHGLPVLINIDLGIRHKFGHGDIIEYSQGQLYYHGKKELPPVSATFLGFRFVPVTAMLQITELTPVSIVSVSGILRPPFPITVRASTRVSVRIYRVRINGVPLPVGPRCQAARPISLVLVGRGQNTIPPTGYTLPTGGPLSGTVRIGDFRHCGLPGNPLTPLFDGAVSGPGNFVLMTQGQLCAPSQPGLYTCPPPVPKAKR